MKKLIIIPFAMFVLTECSDNKRANIIAEKRKAEVKEKARIDSIAKAQLDSIGKAASNKFWKEEEKNKSIKYTYKIIDTRHNNAVHNWYVELKTNEKKEDILRKICTEIRDKLCTVYCNLAIYDDSKYYDLAKKMEIEKTNAGNDFANGLILKSEYLSILDRIDRKYYVKVADHLIGFIDFGPNGYFDHYPYKDWRYKELKGK